LIDKWPALFDPVVPRPLAIGIHKAIRATAGVSAAIAKDVPGEWTARPAYLAALQTGAGRYALDSSVAGEVTEEQAAIARAEAERQLAVLARAAPVAPRLVSGCSFSYSRLRSAKWSARSAGLLHHLDPGDREPCITSILETSPSGWTTRWTLTVPLTFLSTASMG
jgi:hypothetical protein